MSLYQHRTNDGKKLNRERKYLIKLFLFIVFAGIASKWAAIEFEVAIIIFYGLDVVHQYTVYL